MKTIATTTYAYQAVDGETFTTEAACRAYEEGLPRHLRWILERKIKPEDMHRVGFWECGYRYEAAHTTFEPAGFLQKGGDRTYYTDHDTVLLRLHGDFSSVVFRAVQNSDFWRNRAISFVRRIAFEDVNPAEGSAT